MIQYLDFLKENSTPFNIGALNNYLPLRLLKYFQFKTKLSKAFKNLSIGVLTFKMYSELESFKKVLSTKYLKAFVPYN